MKPVLSAALLAANLLAGAAVAAPAREVPLRGRVVDADGHGVEGIAVRLLQTRRDFQVTSWSFEDEILHEEVARTDADGFFEGVLRPDPDYRYFWLRFYDRKTFDAVRYEIPEDRNVTRKLRNGRPVAETVVLQDHPDWKRLSGWIEALGAASPRGRLVRQLGVPDLHETAGGVETFGYTRTGRLYRFRDGAFVGEEAWEATPASGAGGSGS